MRPMTITLSALAICLFGAACGGDSGTSPTEPNVQEDTVALDTTPEDTVTATDMSVPDTVAQDAGVADTAVEDTSVEDVATNDAGVSDVALPEDVGGLDPISFAQVFDEILAPKGCTGGYCHAGHAGGLLMDNVETAYENLVNKETSTETACGVTMRVVPGDPDASMLWVRVRPEVDDCLTAEQKMPPFGEGLSDEDLKLIHDWILTGANP